MGMLYVLDEPSIGLHAKDNVKMIRTLERLRDLGNTVNHLDVVKCADWILDLGPEGGHQGGHLIVAGTPEAVAACEQSHTGRALRAHLAPART